MVAVSHSFTQLDHHASSFGSELVDFPDEHADDEKVVNDFKYFIADDD